MKKITAVCVMLTFIFTLFPFSAFAAESYGIEICKTEVTSENKNDILNDGTVSYNSETKTLTLSGASLSCEEIPAIQTNQDITINLKGKNTIYTKYIAIFSDNKNISFLGRGSLGITAESDGSDDIAGIYTKGNVSINETALGILLKNGNTCCGIYCNDFYINNSELYIENITAKTHAFGIYTLGDCYIGKSKATVFANTSPVNAGKSLIIDCIVSYIGENSEKGYSYFISDIEAEKPDEDKQNTPDKKEDKKSPDSDIIDTDTDEKDPPGSQFRKLRLKATSKKKTITLKWKTVKDANKYIIYGAKCGKKMKKLKTVKKNTYTFKKLKKGKYYKYIVVACKGNKVLAKSKTVHCATDGGKKGNPTGIKVSEKLSVKKGKSKKIKATLLSKKKVATHIAKFRYESANTKIAKVDKKGNVTGIKKGKTTIYIYTQNGIYKKIKITVK